MSNKYYLIVFFISISLGANAQIFQQDFSSSTSKSSYINIKPEVGQLSGISNSSNVLTSITNGALRFTKIEKAGSYFYRTPAPELTPEATFTQLQFDFEVSNNNTVGINRDIPFYFGPNLGTRGTSITTINSRFGLGISTTAGNFYLKILDNGSTQSADFTGKQTITCFVNNSGSLQTYTAPNGSTESIPNDTWEIWVGTAKIFNDVAVKNPTIGLGGFKMQYNSFLPNAVLDFDNFEYKDLLTNPIPAEPVKSLVHPHIFVKNSDKQAILDNIANHDWAKSFYDQLITRNESRADTHATNPDTQLGFIPAIPGNRTAHRGRLNVAVESAILYYLTDDEKYAQLAADFLHKYAKMISVKDPLTLEFYTSSSFNHLIPAREHYPRFAIIYDFVYNFISKENVTVYDDATNTRVSFNFETSQKAFEVLADNVLKVGGKNSNHPLLELPGGLYNVMCMEDDKIRETYFNKFLNEDSIGQNSINWMLDRFSDQKLWPESLGYAKFTHAMFIQLMNIIDNYQPDLNIISDNKEILESMFIYENLLYPNGKTVAFGDITRDVVDHAHIFRAIMKIADRKGYADIKQRAASVLKKIYKETEGYKPKVTTQTLEYNDPLKLLWAINIEESVSDTGEAFQGTTIVEHANVVMQRNDVEVNNKDYGLMYYTGGGTYVHAQADGLDMEIYGAGYVIGPDYGSTTYGTSLHEEYASSYAAHNTIIVNGTSGRGTKTNGSSTWQNIVDPIVLEASEPKPFEEKISTNFSFSTQFFDDNINNVDQQRTNSIVRTSQTSGYYVDVFRSLSNGTNSFHDYVFHGLGDELKVSSNSVDLVVTDSPQRYQNDAGDERKQPGWRWFTDAKTSEVTDQNLEARFFLDFDDKYLHVTVPEGIEREYSTALAPATKAVSNSYDRKDTQVFVMRKYGEAWDKPFIALYEPSSNAVSSITSSEYLYQNEKVVGVSVTSNVDGHEIVDYVLSNDKENTTIALPNLHINFVGRFGIVRTKTNENTTDVSLYIGDGNQLNFRDETLVADANNKGLKEYVLNFSLLSTDSFSQDFENVIAYPNPTRGFFTLSVPSKYQEIVLEIYDVKMQLINAKIHPVKEGKIQLNLSNKAKGIYFMKLNLSKPKYIKILKK